MSAAVRLSSRLSGDEETNGLDHLAGDLRANPHQVVCAIAWFTVTKITEDVETGEKVPTVQMRRVEPIATVDKVPAEVIELAMSLYHDRLNRTPLPFDVVETIEGGYAHAEDD